MKYQTIDKDILIWDALWNSDEIAASQLALDSKIAERFYVITPAPEMKERFESVEKMTEISEDLSWLNSSEVTEYTIEIRNCCNGKDISIHINEKSTVFADLSSEVKEDLKELISYSGSDFDDLQLALSGTSGQIAGLQSSLRPV